MFSDPAEERAPRRLSLFEANGLFFLAVAGLFGVGFIEGPLVDLLKALIPGIGGEALLLAVHAAYYVLFMFGPAALMLRRKGAWESARVKPISAGRMLAVAAVSLLGALVALQLAALWELLLEALRIPVPGVPLAIPGTTAGMAAAVLSYAVLPGVCEEFVFRGAILGAYERKGTKRAIAAAAVLFSLVHGSIDGLPTQLMLGAIMGFLAFACDSIYAPIAYHTVHNAALLFLGALAERLPRQAAEGRTLFEQVGGLSGVLQTAAYAAVLGTALLFALGAFNRRRIARGVAAAPKRRAPMTGGARALLIAALLLTAVLYALSTMAA
ncbi:MAG: CPBP family intramembrane metalloprotease [Clostridiales bacterium]|jgi:membrane protease YdiL (CAAX protease family)|nr:CPBP family intramembrane metalloprotease [Clostridiales bacterium]